MPFRSLTEQEIEDILSVIPLPPCPFKEIAEYMRESMIKVKRRQLEGKKMYTEAIPELKAIILNNFYRSLTVPKDPVGLSAGSALGSESTQMTLNTFHVAGSAQTVSSGVDTLKQIANNPKKRGRERTTIHFNDYNMSRDEVSEEINKLKGVKINELLRPGMIIQSKILETPSWWYEHFFDIVGVVSSLKKKEYYRLEFSTFLLYQHSITLEDIVSMLKESIHHVKIIWSPEHLGIIDIFINEDDVQADFVSEMSNHAEGHSKKDMTMLYFKESINPSLNQVATMNGVQGLTYIKVMEKKVMSYAFESSQKEEGVWVMYFDTIKMFVDGVPTEKILKLLEVCGVTIIDYKDEPGLLEFTVKSEQEPIKSINAQVKESDDLLDEQRSLQNKTGEYDLSLKDNDIYRASIYVFAESNTKDLTAVLSHPSVNIDRTICWNANVVLRTLGIEAAYNVIVRDMYDVIINNGANLGVQHIFLVARAMTYTGNITGITSRGALSQKRGAYANAAFELPIDMFINAATYGHVDKIKAISACIYMGSKCGVGTGGVRIVKNKKKLQELLDLIPKDNTDIDLSVFERGDLIIQAKDNVVVEGGDVQIKPHEHLTMNRNEGQLNRESNVPFVLPNKKKDFAQIKADWLQGIIAKKSEKRTIQDDDDIEDGIRSDVSDQVSDLNAEIQDLLGDVF